ncbi:MAG: hypothetical protein P4L74_00160 [Candidatus Doudnabacteria bacterium]|nr:hypothetical protein [Candidatus Doudnabacteria bacterium]
MGEHGEFDPRITGAVSSESEQNDDVEKANQAYDQLASSKQPEGKAPDAKGQKLASEQKQTKLFDITSVDLHDQNGKLLPDESVRYVAKIDAPGKDPKTGKEIIFHRSFRFVIPKADREAFLKFAPGHEQERRKEELKFSPETLSEQYNSYRSGKPLEIDEKEFRNYTGYNYQQLNRVHHQGLTWESDEDLAALLAGWGYEPGEQIWERPVAGSVEQEIAGLLKDNNFDLNPKEVSLHNSLQKGKGSQLAFYIDGRQFEYPLTEVKDRVEVVLELLKEGQLPVVEKYRAMPFAEIRKIADENDRKTALDILSLFAGIPSRALKLAQKWVDNGETKELLDGYAGFKISQGRQYRGRGKAQIKNQDVIYIFENLGLRLRDMGESIATEAAQQALFKRLHREPRTNEKAKDLLDEAKEFVRGLNLTKLGFKGLQKKIDALQISEKDKGMVYLAACLETGFTPRSVVDDMRKKDLIGPISNLEIFRTSARVALELVQAKAKNKKHVNYVDFKYFDQKQDVIFQDPDDKRPGTFVAKRRTQAGTGAQFVDVAIIRRRAKADGEELKDRILHLPFGDNKVIDSLQTAKELRRMVSGIFIDRAEKGQHLSFDPYIELIKSKTKNNPNFRLTLGKTRAEVDYQSLYDSLSFHNKVEAELFKAVYLDSKKSGGQDWDKVPDWKKQAVYKFQGLFAHSGLPSLTEQLVVEELKNRIGEAKSAAPIMGKDRKVIKIRAEKVPAKTKKSIIVPRGVIDPADLELLEAQAEAPKKSAGKKTVKKKK